MFIGDENQFEKVFFQRFPPTYAHVYAREKRLRTIPKENP
ncbi:hypothetical protein CP02DC22_0643 [Chlamydia psittaci 02DC22]|nr:hypothetical protein CP02DC22_0643 [Chlamydia psittaci 02DC22]EPJ19891.1 hypothetical protein CP02DC23_0985 [Chlamydia psittaci 02DC23]